MTSTTLAQPRPRAGIATARRRHTLVGWAFVAPFAIVFVVFLIAPLAYAFYLSLFRKALIGGTQFVWFENYLKAFTDEHFLSGVWFVLTFSVVLIPVQMLVSLAIALILDVVTTRFARFSRLMIFLPYAIPVVIGALMWGFLYSKNFGPLGELFGLFGANAPDFLSPQLIFFGLLNVVTWQWAGYYMIILYAALQGIDPSIYEAARIDGANNWQIAVRIKVPMITNSLVLILVFALIGTLQFFNEPMMLKFLAAGTIGPDFTPNMYAYQQAFALANFNYGSAISFALGIVVFICVYIFMLATRKRGGFLG
ncbi:carbohydrate ABC transporter permease [Protaetiibacter mangrovi]|uniref:Sugar ABC transporter permease n=1 Tax=Protaetiibacter mangrovi TaxID=2970926 RepID=A0ABT1ZFY2_9MICO|nr:sugar ABC transporter permease [Protaetiibacter mangrovi]MCS0499621.1 sugar ABC transporter permease [Protaetiibacter mangrovi]TPX03142.1 sugar ABC transporter permease [Schumannella luteola]